MRTIDLSLRGIDTLLFRDGKPFDTTPGGVARSMPVPFPSTVAGFLRTRAGQAANGDFETARAIEMRGPILIFHAGGQDKPAPLFRAPADALVYRTEQDGSLRIMRLLPWIKLPDGAGTDIVPGLQPLRVTAEVKPESGYDWWRAEEMDEWLLGNEIDPARLTKSLAPPMDERVHIARDAVTGAAVEGAMFSTSMTAFERFDKDSGHCRWSYLCRAFVPDGLDLPFGAGMLGGEKRIAAVEPASISWPSAPPGLEAALKSAHGVRMVLATPAIFEHGSEPSWIDKSTREGSPPGLPDVRLKLVAAAVPKRQAVSGWEFVEYEENGVTRRGRPKPVRYCAPAGSVYFFKRLNEDVSLSELTGAGWLAPVSCDEETRVAHQTVSKNRGDGFGLALWGVWNPEENR